VQEPVAPATPRRVLVVDNNPVARDLLARMARSWGWPTELADSGEAALQLIEARLQPGLAPFDVIYMDWQMSGMDGWAATTRLRQLCRAHQASQPLVVMVSSSGRESLEHRTHEEQSLLNGFLMKPLTASMLLDATLNASSGGSGLRQVRRPGAGQRRLAGMRILVVEDNLINQQVAEELLMTEGALVSLAANGQLGVDAIAAGMRGLQFHAVLMDMQMPVLDGFGATRVVREQLQLHALPIIAMTANALASDRENCLAAGMQEHVGKPFDLDHLVQTLLRVTGFKPQPAELLLTSVAEVVAVAEVAEVAVAPLATGDGIDVAAALARMGGLRSLYLRSAQEFIHSLPQQLAHMQGALETDRAQCALLAHTLKGTAAILGANLLSQAASRLELQCQDSLAEGPRRAAWADLQGVAAQASVGLQEAVHAMGPAQPPLTPMASAVGPDREGLRTGLDQLMPLLQAQDLSALEAFAGMRETLAQLPVALFDPLEGALQDLELELALQACRSIASWLELSPA
jgi:CheY-like chemotaxis protein